MQDLNSLFISDDLGSATPVYAIDGDKEICFLNSSGKLTSIVRIVPSLMLPLIKANETLLNSWSGEFKQLFTENISKKTPINVESFEHAYTHYMAYLSANDIDMCAGGVFGNSKTIEKLKDNSRFKLIDNKIDLDIDSKIIVFIPNPEFFGALCFKNDPNTNEKLFNFYFINDHILVYQLNEPT